MFISLATGVGMGGSVKVGSSKQEGACLLLKEPGVGQRILPGCQTFRKYAAEHERNWSKYFKSMDFDYTIPGITLVTGVITTTAWGIAVYAGGTETQIVNFNVPVGTFASGGGEILFKNQIFPKMMLREGPYTPPARLQQPTALTQNQVGAISRDQNVFLQFVRIKYRVFGLWKVITAGGSKKSDDGRHASPEPELEPEEQPVWGIFFQYYSGLNEIAQGYDPLDDIIVYIFEVELHKYISIHDLITEVEH